MKKTLSYVAGSLAAILALSACSVPKTNKVETTTVNTASSESKKETSDTKKKDAVTITFAQYSGSGDNEQYLKKMVDNYMKENPHVKVDMQTYGYDDYFTQMTAKVSGGQAPDVFELNYENFVSYAKKGALLPLQELLKKSNIDTSIYNKMALNAFSADNQQYGVPNSFSNVVLIYNKKLFDQAKVAYPTDDWKWEDAMEAAKKIRALGKDIYGYYHPISFNEFYKTVKQNNGSLFNEDFSKFTMDTKENVETLKYMVDMQRASNVMPTQEQLAGMGDWDLFESGRLGMLVTGIWAFPEFTKNCDFDWDIAVEPGHVKKATHFFSNGYVISKDSKVAEEAVKFITYISSNRAATQIRIDAGWELPPVQDEEILKQYKAKTPPTNREAVFKSLDSLVTPPVITQYAELQDIVGKHLNAAASGAATPEQALKDMQAECEKQIDLSK